MKINRDKHKVEPKKFKKLTAAFIPWRPDWNSNMYGKDLS